MLGGCSSQRSRLEERLRPKESPGEGGVAVVPFRRGLLGLALLAPVLLAIPLFARAAEDDEVAPDVPQGAQGNLFHTPVRLSAEDGVIDSGASWGHSSPWVVDVDGDGVRDLVVGDFSGLFR